MGAGMVPLIQLMQEYHSKIDITVAQENTG